MRGTTSVRSTLWMGAAMAALATYPSSAQDKPQSDSQPSEQEIIVTGTLLRGKAPVGSNAITLGAVKLEETGAATANELLASLPQVTNYFNRVPSADLSIAVNQLQVSRPNIRNISPNNATSSATLVLVDGHRVASVGVSQASVDPDLVPTGAIERVEVMTEGGSATYGADAVAGVINFITRKHFNGLKVDGHYGFADDYWQWDAGITAGKDWGTGSAWVSYSFTKNDALFGRDRSYIRNVDYSAQPYIGRDRQCAAPNIAVNTTYFGLATLASLNYTLNGGTPVANSVNACDNSKQASVVPSAERHGVMAGLYQELDDSTTIDVRAFYSQRDTRSYQALTGTVAMSASNPYYIALPGAIPANPAAGLFEQQAVSFSFEPVTGQSAGQSGTHVDEWGANFELKKDLGKNWQLRGLFNYSSSNSSFYLNQANNTRLNAAGSATTAAMAINPYNIAATNPALIADILDNQIAGQARDNLLDLRGIAEGKLFDLPGGEVRLAVGYEFMHDAYQQRYQSNIRIGTLGTYPYTSYSRDVHSVFGELQVPVVGVDNEASWIKSLVLSASGRYDHYSDFGETFNPKFGATLKPAKWLTLRGNWGTSFTAPTPLDQLGSQQNTISSYPFSPFIKPGDPASAAALYTVALQGSQPNLKPQKADTWSVGFDADVPLVQGLRTSLSYFDVTFRDILQTPTPNATIYSDFPNNITANASGLTPDQLRAFAALASNGSSVVEPLIASGTRVYSLVDFRTGNFGILKVKGLDFSANYTRPTGFGSIDLAVNGNYQLSRQQQVSATSPVTDNLYNNYPRFTLQTMAGATIGTLRAQATWNHNSGFGITPTATVPVQYRIGAFDTINLFFKYDVPASSGLFKDLSFTVNVNNVLDTDPPYSFRNLPSENGIANGFTLGRMVILGASKKF